LFPCALRYDELFSALCVYLQPLVKECEPNITQTVLDNLQPGTQYVVHVIPLYGELVGRKGSDEATTGNT